MNCAAHSTSRISFARAVMRGAVPGGAEVGDGEVSIAMVTTLGLTEYPWGDGAYGGGRTTRPAGTVGRPTGRGRRHEGER
ncbi:hypothetical protein GCM10010219_05690 [Streptomyces netropsis]|nr:hypothetical protein GCM10010219_05690 [Streptomyces netropsis]